MDVDNLNDDERNTFNRLLGTLNRKRNRNRLKSKLYDAKKDLDHFGISIPPQMKEFATVIGWPAKAVDTPARRIRPDGFSLNTSSGRATPELFEEVQSALATPRAAAVEKLAIQASLKHSCAFVFTTGYTDDTGEPAPMYTAASALDASAVVDPRTGATLSALEVIDGGWVLYRPGKTIRVERDKLGRPRAVDRTERNHNRVTCTVYTWGRTIDRPFGRSRITRPLIGLTYMGVRVLLRQEVSAEFFSSPQRWMLGARPDDFQDESGKILSAWEAITGGFLSMPDLPIEDEQDAKLRRVEIGQFPQMSMQPHSDHLRTVAMMVSAETSLPLNYLGIVQENPPSADAIRASEADMTQIVEDELDWFRDSRVNLAKDTAAVLHEEWTPEMARDLRGLHADFRDPSTPTKSAEGDWAVKIVTAFPWLQESETMLRIIFSANTARALTNERKKQTGSKTLEQLRAAQSQRELTAASTGNSTSGAAPAATPTGEAVSVVREKLDALGIGIRAGTVPEATARMLGLDGVEFTGAVPVSLRLPETEAAALEEK